MAEKDDDTSAPKTLGDKLDDVIALIVEGEREDEIREILRTEKYLLHEACSTGSILAVKSLLDRGVPTSEWNKSYLLPLHLAADNNEVEIAEALLKHDPETVDRPSKFGETPLHFACMKGHFSMVQLLINYKADVRNIDRCGNTILHYAVASNNADLVEFLLSEKDLVQIINKRNEFQHSPIHRAAVLQCVEVIKVLINYRAKINIRDKNGLTPLDFAHILYNNERVEVMANGQERREAILSQGTNSFLPPPNYDHIRSMSFSQPRSPYMLSSTSGSIVSLPVSDASKRKPSTMQSKRPVNLSFSQSYSKQVSASSSQGSRSSDIYLKDKEQAERLSEALDHGQGSVDQLEKIILDQTSYEPPIDVFFVPPVQSFTLDSTNTRYISKDHDIKLKISDKYWMIDPNEELYCKLAASLSWNHTYPSGYIFVSPICFFSCRSTRACEVKLTLPHSLYFPSEKHHRRIIVFFTNTINLETGVASPTSREFLRLATSELTIDTHYVSFTTSIKYPTLFAVGVASAPQVTKGTLSMMYPLLPMRCCLYVACPSDKEQYVTNTDIFVYVAMNLKTVEICMQRSVIPHDFTLEEKGFVLYGQVMKVTAMAENDSSDWQLTRRGTGLFRYNQIALSQETEQDSSVTFNQTYPLKDAFFIECHNPDKALKCRLSAECEGKELINMLVTPYTPIKHVSTLDPFSLHEKLDSPLDMSSSSESIPMRTSSV